VALNAAKRAYDTASSDAGTAAAGGRHLVSLRSSRSLRSCGNAGAYEDYNNDSVYDNQGRFIAHVNYYLYYNIYSGCKHEFLTTTYTKNSDNDVWAQGARIWDSTIQWYIGLVGSYYNTNASTALPVTWDYNRIQTLTSTAFLENNTHYCAAVSLFNTCASGSLYYSIPILH